MRTASKKAEDRRILQELVPLNALSEERFQELAGKIVIEEVKAGRYLFRKGDRDSQTIYLLEGKISLIDGLRMVAGEVESGTEISRYPVAGQQPRPFSARVARKSVIARIDSSLLDVFLNWDQSSAAEVMDIGVDENNDWMTRLLQSEAFSQLPPAKLQALLMKMEPVEIRRGEVVIEEGSEGDYFYTIHEGRCAVTRLDKAAGRVQVLAELSDGDSFGEDALVTMCTRNATVTMLTDGLLMRLAKQDFDHLLKEELVRHVSIEQAESLVREGAVWIDVRTPDEYQQGAFVDSANIPLANLRGELPELVFNSKYIICCDTGRRSESAGFLLRHKGYDVCVLSGGISGILNNTGAVADGSIATPDMRESMSGLGNGVAEAQSVLQQDIAAADTSEQISGLLSESAAMQARYESLLDEQQRQAVVKESLEKQLEQLRGELGESVGKMTELYALVPGLDEERRQLREQNIALQAEHADQLSSLQLDLNHEQHKSQSLQREIEALSGERALLTEDLESGRQEYQTTLVTQKSAMDELRQQIAILVSSVDEISSERGQLKLENQQLVSELAGLRAANDGAGDETVRRDELVDELRAANVALEQVLESVRADSSSQVEALQCQHAEQQILLKELQEKLSGESRCNEQATAAIGNLQEENSHLHASMRELSALVKEQSGKIEDLHADRKVLDDLNLKQQAEWETERESSQAHLADLNSLSERLSADLAREQAALEQAGTDHEGQRLELVERNNAALERQEQQFAEIQGSLVVRTEELEIARLERSQLQKQHDETAAEKARIEAKAALLQAELTRLAEGSEQQIAELQQVLQQGEFQLLQLQNEFTSREEQVIALRLEIGQHELTNTVHKQELELVRAQLQEMQGAHEMQGDQARKLEQSLQDATRKAHEDLRRKNDNEKELQGQVERLRKKLEQVTGDYQKSRKDAQDDIDRLREELQAERVARDDERAQMAARQRELKEQLAAIASDHEVNVTNRSGAIEEAIDAARNEEQARLQGVLEAQAANEMLLEQVQAELRQARAELAEYHRQEKDRRQVDIDLIAEQNQQAEAAINQLHKQLRQLTEERDNALEEQITLRENMDVLRGEVEVTRGLMNATGQGRLEDPVQLRRQLDETRKNVEIAVRLRAEAEAVRDRLQDERDRLREQVEGVQHKGANSMTSASANRPEPVSKAAPGPVMAASSPRASSSNPQPQATVAAATAGLPRWLGPAIGVLVLAVAGVFGWSMLSENPSLESESAMQESSPTDTAAPVQSQAEATRQISSPPVEAIADQSAQTSVMPAPVVVQIPVESAPVADVPASHHVDAPATPVIIAAPVPVIGSFSDDLIGGGKGPEMVKLAAAAYQMGSSGNSINSEEVPRHDVTLRAFSISSREVSFADYDHYARATGQRLPYDESWGRGQQPVINVSWKDAQGYVRWLSAQTGKTYRLPAEAEWEYAARAGNVGSHWWTEVYETIPANCFNCGSKWDGARTAPVSQFAANSLGLYDMAGNVQEWTADCYHQNYVGAPADGSAWEGEDCSQRVVRGGAYSSSLDALRSAKRAQLAEDTRLDNLGFRVVRAD